MMKDFLSSYLSIYFCICLVAAFNFRLFASVKAAF